jgi:immunity protein 7 of polymorphic toxin system
VFEYHGWICLRATPAVDDDTAPYPHAEISRLVAGFGDYGLVDLRPLNGTDFLHVAGQPNHAGGHQSAVVELFGAIGRLAPGSYGLLYVQDDEDPRYGNEFRVHRLVRGVLTEHADPFLSPVIPTLEDDSG